MRVADLCKFIKAREAVRVAKEAGKPQPWTKDPILAKYRFCNVHREDDKVTRWIAEHWRGPNASHPDLWFAMVFARLFNLPLTLECVGAVNVLTWKPYKVRSILRKVRNQRPIFNGAYIVSTNGKSMDKVDYLIQHVLGVLWIARKDLRPRIGDTLAYTHANLMRFTGMGSFMAAQVVADLKYVEPLLWASDWRTFAASGPGSRRGLNRVCLRPVDASWPGSTWGLALGQLHDAVSARLAPMELHAQDLQNCLCEFDKYERVRLGEGTPKQLYKERTT